MGKKDKPSSRRDTHTVLGVKDGAMRLIEVPRPSRPPENCGLSNEELECLGCGEKLGCIKPGHCFAVEGQAAKEK